MVLFVVYFFLIILLIFKSNFFESTGLNFYQLLFLFSFKVVVGFVYSKIFASQNLIEGADTWTYFIESKTETDFLLQNPIGFCKDLFVVRYSDAGGLFSSSYSYWNDLKANFFIKILAILNVFSNKNYYVNLLFFNWLFLYGGLVLIKLANQFYTINKYWLIVGVFLAPSALFWCSALHKDGIVYSATVFLIYTGINLVHKTVKLKYFIVFCISALILFALRNYYLLAIIPPLIGYYLVVVHGFKATYAFNAIIVFCIILLLFSSLFKPISFIANSMVEKHNDFSLLLGNSKFTTPTLSASPMSLMQYFPFALKVAFFHPLVNYNLGFKYWLIAFENLVYLTLTVIALIKLFKQTNNPLIATLLTTSFLLSIFIGYIVCFDAAIIRYRSCFLPLLLVACILVVFGKTKTQKLI